jgi:hypothetical protein
VKATIIQVGTELSSAPQQTNAGYCECPPQTPEINKGAVTSISSAICRFLASDANSRCLQNPVNSEVGDGTLSEKNAVRDQDPLARSFRFARRYRVSRCRFLRSALQCSGASQQALRVPACGELPCFRHQLLRLLNGFRFFRIHASSDLSPFTCVWHIFMVPHFCHARRLVLRGSATIARPDHSQLPEMGAPVAVMFECFEIGFNATLMIGLLLNSVRNNKSDDGR